MLSMPSTLNECRILRKRNACTHSSGMVVARGLAEQFLDVTSPRGRSLSDGAPNSPKESDKRHLPRVRVTSGIPRFGLLA